jgi:hypothetical protein
MTALRAGTALAAATVAVAGLAAAPSPARTARAAALHRCHVGQKESEHFGPTYVTSIKVRHVHCATAKRVVRAFHACRMARGGIKGRCPHSTSVLGFHCREHRLAIKTQYSSKVTCARGSRRVVHTYTQFT